ncbi:cytochrome [Sesamum angolense]|uniref:Cytochrome n=1 Tax=Sesamum angolense TaxID=2727404 RepID=A0AAE1X661_9LAMI|nr:cytochrome [Sesamum angolense]
MPGRKLRHPPGPPGLPFFGNLLQYDPSNLHLRLAKLSEKYGPLMSMTLVGKPMIIISSARVAKEALKHNDLAFSSRPSFICSRKLTYNNRGIAFSPYTEYWREMRKMVVLRLFTLKQVNSFRPAREEEVARMVKEIFRRANAQLPVNINETALSLSSSMICRFALGKRYDEEGGSEKRRFDRLLEKLQELTLQIFVGDFFPWLGWTDNLCGRVSRLEKGFKDLDSFYEELIEEHLSPNRPESMNGDILDLLIQLREDRSSSVQIDWDHVKGVLMQEIRSLLGKKGSIAEDDIHKLPYFKAIVKETLRLFPPAPLSVPRLTTKASVIDGYEIESNTIVYVNDWAIGRDPDFWENPDEFLPEKFLNSSVDFKGQDFGFLPFGSGRRVCPGMALGIAEVEVALANLLYSFDWDLPVGMVEDDVDLDCLPGVLDVDVARARLVKSSGILRGLRAFPSSGTCSNTTTQISISAWQNSQTSTARPLMSMTLVGKPMIIISSARVAKEALKDNDLAFSSRPSFICARKLTYNHRGIISSPYTEYWREMRKMVVLRLFTLKQVNSFRPVREEEVARMRYDEEGGSEKRRFDRLLKQLQELMLQIFIGDYFPWLGWIDNLCGRVARLEKGFKDLDSFYEELIEEHLSPNRPDSMNGDILS